MIIGGTLCGIEERSCSILSDFNPYIYSVRIRFYRFSWCQFLASSVGSTFSTINPFSVVIASNAAGTTFTDGLYWRIGACIVGAIFVISYLYWYCKKIKNDPKASYSYEDKDAFEQQWSVLKNE